jgi:hypothetical protein
MYSLTIFKNRYDNKTHKRMNFESWDEFVSLLYKLSEKPETKVTAPLISPAIYEDGTTRSNKNVRMWGKWAAVDVDDIDIPADKLMEILTERFGHWDFVCYSTASSSMDRPKFRLVFNLMEVVHRDNIAKFWYALNTELDSIGDRQTKDLSRMYYVPANYDGAHNFIFHNAGNPVDIDYLVVKHPYKEREGKSFLERLPEEMQRAVIEHRKQSLNNTSITWSGYTDCPFFPKKLAMEYQTITSTGWYHKMFQIMVAVAGNAVKREYPITAKEIAKLCSEFDKDNGNWYNSRPLELEADSALEYIYRNG